MADQADDGQHELALAEDDPDDRLLITRALRRLRPQLRVAALRDGIELIDYLQQRRGEALPRLVLLDLNMPRMDGREVLSHIRADAELRYLEVVVLTTSIETEDRDRAQALQASGYFSKPEEFSRLSAVLDEILCTHLDRSQARTEP